MLSNSFWHGFAIGAGLVFLIFFVVFVIVKNKAKLQIEK